MKKGETKEESERKKMWVRVGRNDFNFMVAKGLFWFEYAMSVLWGVLLSERWWLKLKSSSRYFLFLFYGMVFMGK